MASWSPFYAQSVPHKGTNFSLFAPELVPCSKYQLSIHSLLFSDLEPCLGICSVWETVNRSYIFCCVEPTSRKKQVPALHFPQPKIHTRIAQFYYSVVAVVAQCLVIFRFLK